MAAPSQRKRRRAYVPQYLPHPQPLLAPEYVRPRRRPLRPGLVYLSRCAPFASAAPVPNTPLRPWILLRRVRQSAGLVIRSRVGSTLVFVIAPAELDPAGATDDTDGLVDYRAATSRIKGQ